MAWFLCPKCGYQQEASDTKIGRVASCPKCGISGSVTVDKQEFFPKPSLGKSTGVASANESGHPQNSGSHNYRQLHVLALLGVILLSSIVVLQVMILLRMNHPYAVEIGNDSLAVDVQNHSLAVEVQNTELDVKLNNHYITSGDPLPVEIQNSEVSVKLNNHYITSGDPLPVRVENAVQIDAPFGGIPVDVR